MSRPWYAQARPEQLPPTDRDWFVYLITAGRGFGKTRAGSEWIAEQAAANPNTHWLVLAPTFRDARKVLFEGPSGILKALATDLCSYDSLVLFAELRNGSTIQGFSGDSGEVIRKRTGDSEVAGIWIDELVNISDAMQLWDEVLLPLMRADARAFVTTTPSIDRECPLLMRMLFDGEQRGPVIHVTGATWDNMANLSERALGELRARYGRTVAGRSQLGGEVIKPYVVPDDKNYADAIKEMVEERLPKAYKFSLSGRKLEEFYKYELAFQLGYLHPDKMMAQISRSEWLAWERYFRNRDSRNAA